MAVPSAIIEADGNNIITQGTEEFLDCRTWYMNSRKEALCFTDDLRIAKTGADGSIIQTSDLIDGKSIIETTMCINRDESLAYILHTMPGQASTYLDILTVSNMGLVHDIRLDVYGAPLCAIISPDEKIVWLGSNHTLYVMDLDGSNLDSVYIGDSGEDTKSFCLDNNGNFYTFTGNRLIKIATTLPLNIDYTNIYTQVATNRLFMSSGFVLNDYVFMIGNWDNDSKLFKIPLATWNDYNTWSKIYLFDIGITDTTEAQFNASGADNFATFNCTIDGKQTLMQCNLDTLECMPARWIDYDNGIYEFSNDTSKPIARIGIDITKANGCDIYGLLTSKAGATGSI